MGGSAQEKKYLKVKVFSSFTRLCVAVCLTFSQSGNNRETKQNEKQFGGMPVENDCHLHLLTREVLSRHSPTQIHQRYFFAVLLDRLNALAVGAPFDPGLRIRSPLPAAIRLRFF